MMSRISRSTLGGAFLLASCGGSTVMHLGETDTDGGGASSAAGGGAGTTSAGAGGSSMMMTADAAPPACALAAGQSVPLALTNVEYDHTVRDLLGDSTHPFLPFPSDPRENGFYRETAPPLNVTRVSHYAQAAGALANAAIMHLDSLLPCNPATVGEDACVASFITTFGRRAWRRPLTPAEVAPFQMEYAGARANGDMAAGIRLVIADMLGSPHFYQIEESAAAVGLAPLGPYQVASRLSYFIYRSMPDDRLLDTAEGGNLVSKADVEREARRMLGDPKAHDGVIEFFSEWLSLDSLASTTKDPAVLATFDTLKGDMATETVKFTESIFFGDGQFQSLLMSSNSWLNAPLGELYGRSDVMGTFQQVAVDPKVRAGILTQPSFLSINGSTKQGSPTLRGKFIREKLLCQAIPPSPPNVNMTLPDASPGQTNRDRYAQAMTSAACSACHQLMDSIGYGFEEFDTVGRYRTTDNGGAVDASGNLANVDGVPGPFTGAVELTTQLASSTTVRDCVTKQWFRFALSRIEADEDACSLAAATQAIQSSGNLREVVVAIATSDSFRYARW